MTPAPRGGITARVRTFFGSANGIALGVFLLAVATHVTALGNGFVYDDHPEIHDNPLLTKPFDLGLILNSEYMPGMTGPTRTGWYRPVPVLLERIVYAGFKASPFPYHLLVLLLHASTASLLAWFLTHRLRLGAGAFAAAALFAVHPVHTEAVATCYSLKEILSSLLPLAALSIHSGWQGSSERARLARLGGAGAFLALGLFSKEAAAPFAAVLVAWDLLAPGPAPLGTILRERLRPALFHAGFYGSIVLACIARRFYVLGGLLSPISIEPINNPVVELPSPWGFVLALRVAARYARLLLLPYGMTPDYSYGTIPSSPTLLALPVLAGILLVGSLAVACLLSWRIPLAAGFGAVFATATYLLPSNLVVTPGTLASERFLYLPSIGLAMILAWAIERLWAGAARRRRALLAALFAIVLLASGSFTLYRSTVYADDARLARSALANAPGNVVAMGYVAGMDINERRFADAETLIHMAQSIRPDLPRVTAFLAEIQIETGRRAQGLETFARALDRPAVDISSFLEYANLMVKERRWDDAVAALSRGLRAGWGDLYDLSRARQLRGSILLAKGREVQGFADLRIACGIAPENFSAREDLAAALYERKRSVEARALYEAVLAAAPRRAASLVGLGRIEFDQGRLDAALPLFRRATQEAPGDAASWAYLGGTLVRVGDLEGARTAFESAAAIQVDDRTALASLVRIDLATGRGEEARHWCGVFLKLPVTDERLYADVKRRCDAAR